MPSKIPGRKVSRPLKTIIMLLLIWLVLYFSITIISQQVRLISLRQQCHDIEQQIEAEKQLTQELENTKTILDSPEYKEHIAREKLGYLKADEKIFIDSSVR